MNVNEKAAATIPNSTDYSDYDFAQEVRVERLSLLWRITFVVASAFFWSMMIASTLTTIPFLVWMGASAAVVAGCLLAGFLLSKGHYANAVWLYAGGITLAIAVLLYTDIEMFRMTVPYAFPLLIVMVGLMLPPRALPRLLLLAVVVVIGVPALFDGVVDVNTHQIAALILTVLSALVVFQITGEIYAIAEWALSSYRRERERKLQLHQSQVDLQKALARAQVLAENLEETNQELEQTNVDLEEARSAAEEAKNFRGQFLANMSHELRTPLNAVIGFSETMLTFPEMYDDVPLPEEYHRDLGQIYNSGTQLLHVINDILDLSKVDAGKLDVAYEEVELLPIFKASRSTATGLIGDKPIKLVSHVPETLPNVWADTNRVRQVLLNLYSNAAKFTDEGTITLDVEVNDTEVIISVTDTGCGIPPEEQEMIFEEFRQGTAGMDRKVTGSGLGLSISRHLVRLMSGRIWVESTEGVGSKFSFCLNRALPEAEQVVPDTAPAHS
jgi:signal transduction histidine kinase